MLKHILAGAALAAAVSATPVMAQERIIPESSQGTYDAFHYAPAVRAGNLLYLSGVVAALEGDESEFNPDDLEKAMDRAFEEIGVVLAEAGADWSHVVEMTTFHTELASQVFPFTASKDKYIQAPYPAWTAIGIDRLFPERGLVEIKIIAYLGD